MELRPLVIPTRTTINDTFRDNFSFGFRTSVNTHMQPGFAMVLEGKFDCVVNADKTKVFLLEIVFDNLLQ